MCIVLISGRQALYSLSARVPLPPCGGVAAMTAVHVQSTLAALHVQEQAPSSNDKFYVQKVDLDYEVLRGGEVRVNLYYLGAFAHVVNNAHGSNV